MLEDCSTDGGDRLSPPGWPRGTRQIRLLRHAQNSGLSAARNTMLDAARGDYIWFLDSDDLLLPGSVRELQACLERFQTPDLVLCDSRTVREPFQLKHRLRGELLPAPLPARPAPG